MGQTMRDVIGGFIEQIKTCQIEIYNEFSLQHELGIYLRGVRQKKIQFERNVSFFGLSKSDFIKREIDISIFSEDKSYKEAVELKFPRNGQHPEQMFSFCKDIVFLEQLLASGFDKASLLIFADDQLFYSGQTNGIYAFFRGERPDFEAKSKLTGIVQKPTGNNNQQLEIKGEYTVRWRPAMRYLKYALIDIQTPV